MALKLSRRGLLGDLGTLRLAAGILIMYATRVQREEALMLSTFGAAYEGYKERTGRFFPRLRAVVARSPLG